MHDDDYIFLRASALKQKTKPFIMSNYTLSADFYSRIKKERPETQVFYCGISQYFCFNDRQRKSLLKLLETRQKKQEKELKETISLIEEIKKGGN